MARDRSSGIIWRTIFLAHFLESVYAIKEFQNSTIPASSSIAPITSDASIPMPSSAQSASTIPSTITYVESRSLEPLRSVRFATAANATNIDKAEQCWSEIMTWRNSSAAWYNTHIANRTWPLGSSLSAATGTHFSSKTFYPANVSTYTLCDGTPRADVRPSTTHWSEITTVWVTLPIPVAPTFRPQPCEPDPEMCRLWYHESNIKATDELELLRQCGNPAHFPAPCLIGGGPVQLYYFPVAAEAGNLCANNRSVFSDAPIETAGPQLVTTNGHTFSAGSAYIWFKTLYASYDGFWDRVGPTFSDYILTVASTEVSTHCGGAGSAFGHGTQMNYADLNWPVPASAYACQSRCSPTWIDPCSTCAMYKTSDEAHCGTIWSDIDPVLAVPTKVRDLAPEWSTCSFWDVNIPNFWFDPPVALQPRAEAAAPTMPTVVVSTTPAAPSSTLRSPQPQNTAAATTADVTEPIATLSTDTSTHASAKPSAPPAAIDVEPTANSDPGDLATSNGPNTFDDPGTPTGHEDPSNTADANGAQAISNSNAESEADAVITAPVLSIFASALSTLNPTDGPIVESAVSNTAPAAHSVLNPDPESAPANLPHAAESTAAHGDGEATITGAILTLGDTTITATQTHGSIIFGSVTLSLGQETTLSGVTIEAHSSGLLADAILQPFTEFPASPPDAPLLATTLPPGGGLASLTLAYGSVTITETIDTSGIYLDGTLMTKGGSAVVVLGETLSMGSGGMAVHGESTTAALTLAPTTSSEEGDVQLPRVTTASGSGYSEVPSSPAGETPPAGSVTANGAGPLHVGAGISYAALLGILLFPW